MHKDSYHYSNNFKLLHWVIALLAIGMLIGSFFLGDLPKAVKGTAFMLHKSTGILILFLMLVRFVWIHVSGKPALPETVPTWQRFASRFVQYCLYLFLILMPLSGWVMAVAANKAPKFYGLFKASLPWVPYDKSLAKLMNQTHEVIAWVLIVLVTIHVLAALKHHLIDKDDVMQRMLFK